MVSGGKPRPTSAGLLMFRRRPGLEVLLVHPGGPYWAKKDLGAWTVPKGLTEPGEDPLDAARREFAEETGFASEGPFLPLAPIVQKSGKIVTAWAFEGDGDAAAARSNTCFVEWPPRSGKRIEIPEADRAAWFPLAEARRRINPAQVPLLDELEAKLSLA